MKRYSLKNKSTLLVLLILAISALLAGGVLFLLLILGIFPDWLLTSIWFAPILVLAASLIGSVLAAFVMRFYIPPLDKMVAATTRISEGDFSERVDEQTKVAELRMLIDSFNTMAKELQSIEIFRSDFINNFSHEFKTPIVSIRGFAKQLSDEALSEEEKKLYAEIIASESSRLATMSTNVLLLSKLEHQELIGDRKEYSLDEQIRKAILLLEKEWESKNIELDVDMEDITYCGNEDIMLNVWINLLNNAVKYTDVGGRITVRAVKKNGHAVISVSDTGIGMSDSVKNRIFDKFYQGESSHSESGNGLGLSLVKRIIELCHGSVKVISQEGSGSEFTVFLPL